MAAEKAKPEGRQAQKRGRLWHTFVAWSVLAIALGIAVTLVLAFLASGDWPWEPGGRLKTGGWFDVIRSALAAVGLFGLGGAAVLAYRKQRTTESQHQLDSDIHAGSRIADFRARYTSAAEQLGHDKPAVRLAGVYAMASLADDWNLEGNEAEQQVCIDVLCAYMRMPYDPDDAPTGEKGVRETIIRVICDHLSVAHDADAPNWYPRSFDFSGATFDSGSFYGANFVDPTSVNFRGAKFERGFVSFSHTQFFGGAVLFDEVQFSSGTVSFDSAEFSGGIVSFSNAKFVGSSLTFRNANFVGTAVDFKEAQFEGGVVDFEKANFSDGTFPISFWKVGGSEGGLLNFKAPQGWDYPPDVPWEDGSVPDFVEPKDWPPKVLKEWVP